MRSEIENVETEKIRMAKEEAAANVTDIGPAGATTAGTTGKNIRGRNVKAPDIRPPGAKWA